MENTCQIMIIMNPWSVKRIRTRDPSETDPMKGYMKIQVSDTGCGIDDDNLPKLFEMFTQGDKRVASVYGGSGLGLWICKQLCQKMGGDIKVYSKKGVGTSFVLYIPVNNDRVNTRPLDTVRLKHDKVMALVVDDYAYNRDLHKLLLEREGVQIHIANNGQEAVDKVQAQGEGFYDFILMDIQMPVMNGFEAAKVIRKWEKHNKRRYVDIFFISGEYFDEEEVLEAFYRTKGNKNEAAGIQCLKKPIDLDVIRKILNKYRVTS